MMPDWALTQIDGQPVAWRATINLDQPGKVTGQAPCNRYFADVISEGSSITVKPIGATRMACPDLAHESRFFELLQGLSAIDQTEAQLTLSGAGHELVFMPVE